MKIVACYKWVVDEADIRVDEKTRKLNFDRVKHKISEYDRNAIEVGAQLHEKNGWEFVAATCGTDVKDSLKDVLSRGPECVYHISDPRLEDADANITAKVLAGMIKKIGNVDLVVCGEGSGDEYAQQVGPRLAALLGYASCTYVNKINISDDGVTAERKLESGVEVIEVIGPAVITVLPDINETRIPSLKQILSAKKKPTTKLSLEDVGLNDSDSVSRLKNLTTLGTVMERKCIRIDEDGMPIKDAMQKLAQQLHADGALG